MATTRWNTPDIVESQLEERPYSFGFFQAMRLLECLYSDKPRFGSSDRAADDPVRFSHEPSLAFESSTLISFRRKDGEKMPRLTTRFLGLFGANGPLPLHLTEFVRDRQRHHDDSTAASFIDMFHHRMLCLFYRAWADTEPTVSYDRCDSDRYSEYLGSIFGIGIRSMRGRDCIPDAAKLYFSGFLSAQTRHADGLSSMLSDYFKVPVAVKQFVGEWMDVPEEELWQLGRSTQIGILGESVILGPRVWSRQHKFRIVLGPLDFDQYCQFLPAGNYLEPLVSLVRNYMGDELAWDVNLILESAEVPPLYLNARNQLGWTTWLGNRCAVNNIDDLMLDPALNTNEQRLNS